MLFEHSIPAFGALPVHQPWRMVEERNHVVNALCASDDVVRNRGSFDANLFTSELTRPVSKYHE